MTNTTFAMNDKAAQLFRGGLFREAAALLRGEIAGLEKAHQTSHGTTRSQPNSPSLAFGPNYDCGRSNDLDSFHVYDKLMAFTSGCGAPDLDSIDLRNMPEDRFNLLSAILIYNYGLCLHLHGLSNGSDRCLKDSAGAYEVSLGLLGLAEQDPSTVLLELALLNNHCHISQHFFDFRETHECLERMRLVLYGVTLAWTDTVPEEMTSFAHNVLYNGLHFARPSPSA